MNEFIINSWKNAIQREGYSLYLHSPFCGDKCKYCVYTGKLTSDKSYSDLYDKYINEYMPVAINSYKEILESRTPENLYFGGGTPNLIKPNDMVRIFDMIPNFDKISNKIIDLHPTYLSNKHIDTLIDSGFTTVCIGIQSFDEKTLKLNNRTNPPIQRIKDVVDRFKSGGVYTSIDLMCYITSYDKSDLNILIRDLELAESLDLDFIDINPNLHLVLRERKYASIFEKVVDEYVFMRENISSEKDVIGETTLNNRYIYRIVNKRIADIFKDKVLPYYADDFPYANNNIIGIGDIDNGHSTMSYIHGELFYVEKNINMRPTYDIKYMKQPAHIHGLKNFLNSYKG